MSADATPDNVLFEWYGRYIGDPDEEADVYLGFALFFGGIALGAVGILVFLLSVAASSPGSTAFALREVAVVASAAGLPALLLGMVVLLPGDRRMTYAALGGVAVCLVAIALFVAVYPMHWNVDRAADYSAQGVAVYAVGLVAVVGATGAALVGHQVERAGSGAEGAAGGTAGGADGADAAGTGTETVTDEQVRRDIDDAMADADISWGGVQKTETRRLELDTETPDDIRTNVDRVSAETTTAEGGDVDEAVSGLRQLQGRDTDVDSGSGVDEQTAALTELKKQRQAEEVAEAESRGPADRVRDLLGL
ncbi:MAG: permease [Haloferacaceae archaeon]